MSNNIVKFAVFTICCFLLDATAEKKIDVLKEDEVWSCVRWRWNSQDINNRQVVCLEWQKKDCSKRLHKEICKKE